MIACPVTDREELAELKGFLAANRLPTEDVDLASGRFYIYRGSFGNILGCGGLEYHGDSCLLRSVAVVEAQRGKAHGKAIVRDLVEKGKASARSMYLLTETARPFFEKLGFTPLQRDEAPAPIRLSTEFASVCPVSAQLMFLPLQ